MSCSVELNARSSVKSKKVNNVIHRVTSETIRLREPDVIITNCPRQPISAISPPPLQKSSCSFQVTGVSLTQRTDVADDSADDIDESHTDDISRVTDNETPSFSEDTCSRDAEESYINSCNALCSVTSQYTLAIIPLETSSILSGNTSEYSANSPPSVVSKMIDSELTTTGSQSLSDVNVAVTKQNRFPGTRFHVVKVETNTPFRRGRWLCMDYLDQSPYASKNPLIYDSSNLHENNSQPQYTMTATSTFPGHIQIDNELDSLSDLNNIASNENITESKIIRTANNLPSNSQAEISILGQNSIVIQSQTNYGQEIDDTCKSIDTNISNTILMSSYSVASLENNAALDIQTCAAENTKLIHSYTIVDQQPHTVVHNFSPLVSALPYNQQTIPNHYFTPLPLVYTTCNEMDTFKQTLPIQTQTSINLEQTSKYTPDILQRSYTYGGQSLAYVQSNPTLKAHLSPANSLDTYNFHRKDTSCNINRSYSLESTSNSPDSFSISSLSNSTSVAGSNYVPDLASSYTDTTLFNSTTAAIEISQIQPSSAVSLLQIVPTRINIFDNINVLRTSRAFNNLSVLTASTNTVNA